MSFSPNQEHIFVLLRLCPNLLSTLHCAFEIFIFLPKLTAMSSQHLNSADRAESIVEDGHVTPEAEEPFASGQHDPDSERTHVTETQLTENYALEMDYLSQSSINHRPGSQAGRDSKAEAPLLLDVEPQGVPPPGYSVTSALRFSRHEIQAAEPQGFAFQAAPKTQMKFGRSMGQRNVSVIGKRDGQP